MDEFDADDDEFDDLRDSEAEERRQKFNRRVMSYHNCFDNEAGAEVLEDLSRFCREHMSTFVPNDPAGRESAFREGRREVLLRILAFLKIELQD